MEGHVSIRTGGLCANVFHLTGAMNVEQEEMKKFSGHFASTVGQSAIPMEVWLVIVLSIIQGEGVTCLPRKKIPAGIWT